MRTAATWLSAYGAVTALIWVVGGFQAAVGAPPLSPTPERLCALYARPQDAAAPAAPLPREIGALAQYGAPHWGTWMPAFTPREPAPRDPYPACVRDERLLALAQSRHDAAWAAWFTDRRETIFQWALAPLVLAPVFALAALILARTAKRPARKPNPSRKTPVAAKGATAGPGPGRRPLAPNAPSLRAQLRR